MTDFYQDTYYIRDGRIMLFTRADTKHPVYQARMLIPNMGYIVRSTKTTDLRLASSIAEDFYDELRWKAKNNIPVKDRKWKLIYDEYRNMLLQRVAAKDVGYSRFVRIDSVWNNWFAGYWGNTSCNSLSQQQVDDYWTFRMNIKQARSTTLHDEGTILNTIFKFALKKGHIKTLTVSYKPPIKRTIERRGAFTIVELRDLARVTRTWHKSNLLQPDARYIRQLFHYYSLINIQCGLRPGEMHNLLWSDIVSIGNGNLKMIVREGKTGNRIVIPMPCIKKYLDAWRSVALHNNDNDYVFPTMSGKRLTSNGVIKTFNKALKQIGLTTDEFGQTFSPYSFRHTYATGRLRKGVDYYWLVKQMGTSLDMLKQHYDHVMIEDQFEELTKR